LTNSLADYFILTKPLPLFATGLTQKCSLYDGRSTRRMTAMVHIVWRMSYSSYDDRRTTTLIPQTS